MLRAFLAEDLCAGERAVDQHHDLIGEHRRIAHADLVDERTHTSPQLLHHFERHQTRRMLIVGELDGDVHERTAAIFRAADELRDAGELRAQLFARVVRAALGGVIPA